MQSAVPADLFGYAHVSKAFEIIDEINESIGDPNEAVKMVAELGGHFSTAYKDLLKFIIEAETPIEYEWAMPEKKSTSIHKISTYHAKPLYEEIIKRDDIEVEEITLIGRLTKVDIKYKTWRLLSDEINREYHGTSDINLAGLVIESRRYEFFCEERLEEERGTGKEITKLYLKSYRIIDV
jgi:hypothetical protein